jgi:NADH:ubiquinone oxidoreductase subunit 5 (subunit L)/multisubunit Na+/H+ antiporter MnhA subunit
MWVPLAVLAVLATIGGFVGISTAFTGGKHIGGRMNIVNFLDPIIWNPTTRYFGTHEIVDSYGKPLERTYEARAEVAPTEIEPAEIPPPYGSEGFNLAHAVEAKLHSETATEWVFILISLLVAGIGIGLGFLFYVKDTRLPDIWAARLRPLYEASYNKYWVDEFFGWAVTRRVMDAALAYKIFEPRYRSHRSVFCRWNCERDGGLYYATHVAAVPRRANGLRAKLCTGDGAGAGCRSSNDVWR